jgi:hypothetical protein
MKGIYFYKYTFPSFNETESSTAQTKAVRNGVKS